MYILSAIAALAAQLLNQTDRMPKADVYIHHSLDLFIKTFEFPTGNLDPCVSKEDICHLFGLEATSYLRSSCWVELSVDANNKSKGYGFVSVPEHIAQQLVKFNGIDFYGKELKIEPARDKDEKESTEEEKGDGKKKAKTDEKPQKSGGASKRGGRGGARGGGSGRGQQSGRGRNQQYNYNGQYRNPRGGFRQRYNLPVLAQDQIFALIDAGVNLTNGRFVYPKFFCVMFTRCSSEVVQKDVP